MPLLRDQSNEARARISEQLATGEPLPDLSGQEHRGKETGSPLPLRIMDQSSKRASARAHAPAASGRHSIGDLMITPAQLAPNVHKMSVPNTIQIHKAANAQHPARFISSTTRKEEQQPTSVARNKLSEAHKRTAFDDTESLNHSFLDDSHEEDRTALVRTRRVNQYSKQEDMYVNEDENNSMRDQHSTNNLTTIELPPGWEHEVDDERHIRAEQSVHTPQPKRTRGPVMQVGPQSQHSKLPGFEERQEPDTPSRTQSAPPVNIVAPAPRKNVNFAPSDQIMNLSPGFISSDMAREDSLEQPISRPSSAQPHVQTIPAHSRPQRPIQYPPNQMRVNRGVLPANADRFNHMTAHMQNSRQQNPKVSAPDSDNQDYSEDERARFPQHGRREEPSEATQLSVLPAKKRSHNDMTNDLDYSQPDLKHKKLSDLQAEPFPQDPRAAPQASPRDNMGNEMNLSQILENLSKMSADAQRETFRTLTDEQWANTGQWFVDKFQTDLKILMETRLERRKVAMNYEDKIRRRQRVVEQHEAQVDKELQELETGGKQLVDGRRVPSGSRSGTPMKGVR